MNKYVFLGLAALLTAFALGSQRPLSHWIAGVFAADSDPGNGACIDPDGNRLNPPPPSCTPLTHD